MPISVKEVSVSKIPASAISIRKFLDTAPPDCVFGTPELLTKLGIGYNTLSLAQCRCDLSKYRYGSQGKMVYWGHPRAIVSLKKQLGV